MPEKDARRSSLSLSGGALKWIAVVSMLIDHAAACILRRGIYIPAAKAGLPYAHDLFIFYRILRSVGRLAFPIYCFLLVEGFIHTRSIKKYALRLGIFALLSEIPFDLCLYGTWWYTGKQNVFWTLLIALLAMTVCHLMQGNAAVQAAACCAAMLLAYLLHTDYQWYGVLVILLFFYLHERKPYNLFAGAAALCWSYAELPALAAFPLLYCYNGKKGRQIKYLFYLIYPVHLLLFYCILRFCFQ